MRKLFFATLLFALLVSASFAVRSSGYFHQSTGKYVAPHFRSAPNHTVKDNYSYKCNINLSTGKTGKNYYRHNKSSDYYIGN